MLSEDSLEIENRKKKKRGVVSESEVASCFSLWMIKGDGLWILDTCACFVFQGIFKISSWKSVGLYCPH